MKLGATFLPTKDFFNNLDDGRAFYLALEAQFLIL